MASQMHVSKAGATSASNERLATFTQVLARIRTVDSDADVEGDRRARPSALRPASATSTGWNLAAIPICGAAPWLGLQAKLEIGPVDDPLEREADEAADRVMRMPDPRIALSRADPKVRCKCAKCEDEEDKEHKVARKESTGSGQTGRIAAPGIVDSTLRESGHPLEPGTRVFFEGRFGRDFGSVRIHTGDQASRSAREIGAKAYTSADKIVFAQGHYNPESFEGRRLLAHELAHVVQQTGTPTSRISLDHESKRPASKGSKGPPPPSAASAPKLDVTASSNGPPCACLVVVHNDEENARKTAELMQQNCSYNLALVNPKGGREIAIPGRRGTVDPNSLFPQNIAEMCLNDEQACRDFLTKNSATRKPAEIQKFVQIQFFLAMNDCSNKFSLPVVALHNNDIEDTKSYLKAKGSKGVDDLKLDVDKSDKAAGKQQVDRLKTLINDKFGPDVENDMIETAGKTNVFRWCASDDLTKCHIGDPDHPDNITWVTNERDFESLRTQPLNVALQTELPKKGSESEGDLSTLFLILRNIARAGLVEFVGRMEKQATQDLADLQLLTDELEKLSKLGDLTPARGLEINVQRLLALLDLLVALFMMAIGASSFTDRIKKLRYINIESPGKKLPAQTGAERVRNYESIADILKNLGLHCCGQDSAKAEAAVKAGLAQEK